MLTKLVQLLAIIAFVAACFALEVRILEWTISRTFPDSTPSFWPIAIAWALLCLLVRGNRKK